MPAIHRPVGIAVVVALLFNIALYLGLTEGLEALRGTEVVADVETGYVPEFLHDPPDTAPTTAEHGPVGPVAAVFAGTEVRAGLFGRVRNPWIAVSSQDGRYRALSAPGLPDPRRGWVSVSPDGHWLAWGSGRGAVLYDALRDETVEVTDGLGGESVTGAFSRNGRRLLVYDDALRVVDVEQGEVVGTLGGVDEEQARQAVWTADGEAVTYVADGALVRHAWADDTTTTTPTSISADATLAWSPPGDQLAAMREEDGVRFVEVFDMRRGRLVLAQTVRQGGYAQQELLGFTGDGRVTVIALTLETGAVPLVFNMSTTDAFPPTRVMQLPARESAVETMAVAADPLAAGSWAFDEPRWPVSDLSKLTGSVVTTVFLLGLYLTRRPREPRRQPVRPRAPERVDA